MAESSMKDKLIQLNCQTEDNFTLHLGGFSNVKWDFESLFDYPHWMIEQVLSDWINVMALISK
jgi:hypothetical protein